jgi:hypothetical protein
VVAPVLSSRWSRWSARQAHNLEVVGSNPTRGPMKINQFNTLQLVTFLVVVAVAVVLGVYDGIIGYQTDGWASISWVLYSQALKRPAISFAFGFLMGHIFASMPGTPPESGAQQSKPLSKPQSYSRPSHWGRSTNG